MAIRAAAASPRFGEPPDLGAIGSDTLGSERRRHARIKQPLEGSWRGASGNSFCRIGDISIGGCFIHGLATPAGGERTTVSIKHGKDEMLSIPGRVVYVEPSMGFAVQFDDALPAETVRVLADLVETLAKKP